MSAIEQANVKSLPYSELGRNSFRGMLNKM
jgi:hypothetical protein